MAGSCFRLLSGSFEKPLFQPVSISIIWSIDHLTIVQSAMEHMAASGLIVYPLHRCLLSQLSSAGVATLCFNQSHGSASLAATLIVALSVYSVCIHFNFNPFFFQIQFLHQKVAHHARIDCLQRTSCITGSRSRYRAHNRAWFGMPLPPACFIDY